MMLTLALEMDIPSGIAAGVFAVVVICLLRSVRAASNSPGSVKARAQLGGLILAIPVFIGAALADRLASDAIDLSESAVSQLTGEMRWFFLALGFAALAIGFGLPRALGGLARSAKTSDRGTLLIAAILTTTLAGAAGAMLILSPVVDSAGVSRVALIAAIGIAAAIGALHDSPWRTERSSSVGMVRISIALIAALFLGGRLTGLELSPMLIIGAAALIGHATVRIALDEARWMNTTLPRAAATRIPLAACVIWAALLLVPMALHVSAVGLAESARGYIAKNAPKPPQDASMYAVCIRPERFAVVIPSMGDGGADLVVPAFLTDRSQFESTQDLLHLEPGIVIPATPVGADLNARRFELKARIAHGDHFHDYDFAILNAQKADLRELALMLGAHGGSVQSLLFVVIAVVVTCMYLWRPARSTSVVFELLVVAICVVSGIGMITPILVGLACAIAATRAMELAQMSVVPNALQGG